MPAEWTTVIAAAKSGIDAIVLASASTIGSALSIYALWVRAERRELEGKEMKLFVLPTWLCRHRWSVPRRRPEFQGHANVDVQTCTRCGTRRLSAVQFGPDRKRIASGREVREVADEAPARP